MKGSPEHDIDGYVARAPEGMRPALMELRAIIQKAAPSATPRTDYFQMPGYSYDQCDYYNGMFVWFSFKKPFVRLHVLPSVIEKHKTELKGYRLTKSIIGFRVGEKIPRSLVRTLVKESGNAIKALSKAMKK